MGRSRQWSRIQQEQDTGARADEAIISFFLGNNGGERDDW